ncbi:N-acetylglutaminylglutamine amidotransferase [Geoalkalibacter halelectricus]|uniref:asparagine synthase (glutamine-hydrolyzing) n=1 Tax=Geoalkalibacter halelectricus TaxID=2847045 RepID=A0ABY5ZQ29_9BACT|nr:N-acetylglutaminylglutamine amidotransferase [Geoalkalibacter halelectricus]MDO3378879.1 N-acetylglutaminylglutamine amidotransferase [Geoalkalibacter halelectricus]UWZ79819.1 N-acetylglutaminylglutamine amidotransferase [Geoalkalibacter halelectricus]
MCGICGDIRFDGAIADLAAVSAMTSHMVPRGPDAAGVWSQKQLAFGHRRLKIIDLSEKAQQPMFDAELGLGIVYNGAIYNYPELRRELETKGYRFFSRGDTEVLLKAYHAWGEDFVQRLNGMFAFALWERDSGRVLLGRDRLGIKPLYYAEVEGGLRLASSLPALLAAGGVDTRIDPVALHYYLSFHAVVPAPHTILRGVRKLAPGHTLRVEPQSLGEAKCFWEPRFERQPGDATRPFEEWRELVLDGVTRAVRRRLLADVPVGALLSGGLDSSLIVGLLAEQGQKGLKTYSVGFESVGEEKGDEFQYSDLIAAHYGTEHHRIFVDSARLLPALGQAVGAMSEPMISHDAVGFYLLSEEVSKDVKVVQSGQGADEVFAGYHWYPPLLDSRDPVADYCRVFCDRDHAEMAGLIHPDLLGDDHARAFVAEHFARPGASDGVDKALRLDTTIMLVDDPVKRVDNMTMAWGLEARVPFLDHELVELAARIPARYKVAEGGKYVLKEAARQVIPAAVIDRPKGYFPVPALKYIRGPYLEFVRDILQRPEARRRGLFQPAAVERLLAEPERHITPLRGSKLWQVALLEYWLQLRGI